MFCCFVDGLGMISCACPEKDGKRPFPISNLVVTVTYWRRLRWNRHCLEENGRFLYRKTQIRSPYFTQLAAHPQAWQGQGRVFAGGDNQVHVWR